MEIWECCEEPFIVVLRIQLIVDLDASPVMEEENLHWMCCEKKLVRSKGKHGVNSLLLEQNRSKFFRCTD